MPLETAPFAASRDAQQALQRRIEAMGEAAAEGLAGLVTRLGTLPGAARFEPFAQVLPAPEGAPIANAGEAQPARRARRPATPLRARAPAGRSAPGLPPSATLPAAGLAGLGAAARLAAATLQPLASALPGAAAVQAALSDDAAGPTQASAEPLTLPQIVQATILLTELMESVSGQLADAEAPQTLAELTARGALAGVGAVATAVVQTGIGALGPGRGGAARPASRPGPTPQRSTPWIAQVLQATDALRQLAPQPEPAANAPGGASKLPALVQRATSRLLAPFPPSTGETLRDEGPAAPPCAPAEDELGAALQRALLDQAWLRGVDLR